jgi:hypothetical protein
MQRTACAQRRVTTPFPAHMQPAFHVSISAPGPSIFLCVRISRLCILRCAGLSPSPQLMGSHCWYQHHHPPPPHPPTQSIAPPFSWAHSILRAPMQNRFKCQHAHRPALAHSIFACAQLGALHFALRRTLNPHPSPRATTSRQRNGPTDLAQPLRLRKFVLHLNCVCTVQDPKTRTLSCPPSGPNPPRHVCAQAGAHPAQCT